MLPHKICSDIYLSEMRISFVCHSLPRTIQIAGSCYRNLTLSWPWVSSLLIAHFLNICPSDIFTSPPRSFKLTPSNTFLHHRPVALFSYYLPHTRCVCHITIRFHCLVGCYVVSLLNYQFTVLYVLSWALSFEGLLVYFIPWKSDATFQNHIKEQEVRKYRPT
jgi:hypothetical protein